MIEIGDPRKEQPSRGDGAELAVLQSSEGEPLQPDRRRGSFSYPMWVAYLPVAANGGLIRPRAVTSLHQHQAEQRLVLQSRISLCCKQARSTLSNLAFCHIPLHAKPGARQWAFQAGRTVSSSPALSPDGSTVIRR